MNDDLRTSIESRLASEGGGQKNWAGAVLAACDGRDAQEEFLVEGRSGTTAAVAKSKRRHAGAFLSSLTVQGFRGIGAPKTIAFTPDPAHAHRRPRRLR